MIQATEYEKPANAERIFAKIVSYIFHPLFLPSFIFLWLRVRFPFEFPGITPKVLFEKTFSVIWITAFFPAFSVFLLWRLKFISNIFLRTAKERIAPYIITMIFYWWMWYLSRYFTDQPEILKAFYFGIFVATVFGLILNNFMKISMHAMGVGGILTFVIITCFYYQVYLGLDMAVTTIVTGLVCSCRLALSEHSKGEIYLGLFVGIFCQLIGYWIAM
ncbi:MAG: hypothetical protein JSS67_12320 [Bacteroidetes bacterium]|nr:hypothetical protein [Bacteroidota bacterium]